jgi:hypothetical protein
LQATEAGTRIIDPRRPVRPQSHRCKAGRKIGFGEVSPDDRWQTPHSISCLRRNLGRAGVSQTVREAVAPYPEHFGETIEYVPTWVVA